MQLDSDSDDDSRLGLGNTCLLCDTAQIVNKRYNDCKKIQSGGAPNSCVTFSDHLQAVARMQTEETTTHARFIQDIHYSAGKVASIVLFTENCIEITKQMCCHGDEPYVLGVDRTFNLGDIFVTVTSFKHTGLLRARSADHPVIFGPLLLHDNSTTKVYRSFSVICTRHLKKNLDYYMQNKVWLPEVERKRIKQAAFGSNGVAAADDSVTFEERARQLCSLVEENATTTTGEKGAQLLRYVDGKTLPLINDGVVKPNINHSTEYSWTNNNPESANHILKRSQEKDMARAILGTGNFRLEPSMVHHQVSVGQRSAMTKEQNKKNCRVHVLQEAPKQPNFCLEGWAIESV